MTNILQILVQFNGNMLGIYRIVEERVFIELKKHQKWQVDRQMVLWCGLNQTKFAGISEYIEYMFSSNDT